MTTNDDAVDRGAAFDQLFADHYVRVMRASYLVVLNRAEAEDIAQEAFARVLDRMRAGHQIDREDAYVYTVAMNLSRKYRGRRFRRDVAVTTDMDEAPQSSRSQSTEEVERVAERLDVVRALSTIRPRERAIVVLVDWLQFPVVEAAQVLGDSPGAARVRLHRARKAIKSHLGGGYDELGD